MPTPIPDVLTSDVPFSPILPGYPLPCSFLWHNQKSSPKALHYNEYNEYIYLFLRSSPQPSCGPTGTWIFASIFPDLLSLLPSPSSLQPSHQLLPSVHPQSSYQHLPLSCVPAKSLILGQEVCLSGKDRSLKGPEFGPRIPVRQTAACHSSSMGIQHSLCSPQHCTISLRSFEVRVPGEVLFSLCPLVPHSLLACSVSHL